MFEFERFGSPFILVVTFCPVYRRYLPEDHHH